MSPTTKESARAPQHEVPYPMAPLWSAHPRRREVVGIVRRAVTRSLNDDVPLFASAVAYSAFLAIPAALLVVTGLFSLVVSPQAISDLMDRFAEIVPAEAAMLLEDSLTQLADRPGSGVLLTIVGLVLAIWATTGAMTGLMTAVNVAYGVEDRRGFVRKRLVALAMVACVAVAFVLVFGLLVLGPALSRLVASAFDAEGAVRAIWWAAQWPVLIAALMVVFAAVLYLAPDVEHRRWRVVSLGSAVAVVVWLAASGGFAVYTSMFGSYNKTWGSLAAVIVMLTWLWLTSIALLLGAHIDAEVERSATRRPPETGAPGAPPRE